MISTGVEVMGNLNVSSSPCPGFANSAQIAVCPCRGSLGMMSYGQYSVMITMVKANSLLKGFHCDTTCTVYKETLYSFGFVLEIS